MSQITFTTEDVKEAAKWFDFIYKQARWGTNISSNEAQEVAKCFNWFHKHVKMMNDHIMELVEHIPVSKEDQEKQDKAEKKAKK